MNKQLLFSITSKDFTIQTFRSGGKGGQNQNKVESGVRLIHKDSGAISECREERSQLENKRKAFKRILDNDKFKNWMKLKTAYSLKGIEDMKYELNRILDEQMQDKYLKIETFDT